MNTKTETLDLTDAELDSVTGGLGYKLQNVAVKSFSASGAGSDSAPADPPPVRLTMGYTPIKHTY